MSAKFGPAGNGDSFSKVHSSSLAAPKWVADFGLDCYEYECGKGVRVGEDTAREMGENAKKAGISLSLHAPYFINLANPDPDSLQKTIGYITAACQAADWMGASRVVIHSGALMKRTRRQAQDIALKSLREVIAACDGQGFGHIALCPETMGKINQLGDLDEVLELCTLDARLIPCLDFGHLYARSLGELEGHEACVRMLDRVAEVLGEERAAQFHGHFSHIQFTPNGGEKCHRTFSDDDGFGPDWMPLAAQVARRGWSPTFICESAGTQAEDALTMKRVYEEFARQTRSNATPPPVVSP
jgi:deoxyribonuclease-4